MADSCVVVSKVRQMVKDHDCNTAGDFCDGLNSVVEWYVKEACRRAKSNGRKTARKDDL